jgi:hypothetical protein
MESIDSTLAIALIVVGVLILAAAVWAVLQARRRRRYLQHRFGPEYDHAVDATGSKSRAEKELAHREQRVRQFELRPLGPADFDRFTRSWQDVQARFVDDPLIAVAEADRLVDEVMRTRGYPMGDFEQRAADISVDHPQVVEHYRAARVIATRARQGQATTEDLRQAMVHYRTLFEDLLVAATGGGQAGAPRV